MAPYLTLMTRGRPAAAPRPARGLQRAALDRAHRRAVALCCRPTSRPGRRSTSRPSAGSRPAVFEAMVHDLRAMLRWSGGPRRPAHGGHLRQRHAANARRRAGTRRLRRAQAAQGQQDPRSPSTRWATCWPCTSPRPTPRTGRRSRRWPRRCRTVDRGDGGGGLRRPGLHRRASRRPTRPTHGIRLEVVKLPEAKRGFVLLPRRWVVERSFAWAARFRRLARDYERLPETVAGLHFVAFACLMLHRLLTVAAQSHTWRNNERSGLG